MAKTKVIRRRVVEDTGVQRPGWERVGQYMYYFGQLELALSDLLHRSLGLSKRAATLLLPRVMYAAKLGIIEAIIPMLKQPDSWKSKATQIEASSLQRNVDAAKAYTAQAQAQVAEANTQVAIANQRIALAQLQQRDAEENRDYLDMKEFNAHLWFELAGSARRIMQRYTDMATAVALLAQRAYNAETGRNLNVIRGDYTHSATDNLMGADFLSLDLDSFTYDYVTTTKTKKAPVKRIISLADNYPYAFNQLQNTGHCSFQTELAMFDRQTSINFLQSTHTDPDRAIDGMRE